MAVKILTSVFSDSDPDPVGSPLVFFTSDAGPKFSQNMDTHFSKGQHPNLSMSDAKEQNLKSPDLS